ncbi:MAG: phosphoribosylamine--glycine ligase [Pseudomonadota bacterium]
MRVLIVGSGGREHALAWRCAQSPGIEQVFVAPGNAGTAQDPRGVIRNLPIAADALEALIAAAREQRVDLTIVGPEAPLVAGIRDRFDAAGLRCFGPHAAAAQLEGSKSFAKAFLARHRIPTARYRSFSDRRDAIAYVRAEGAPIVVKADGLAAGKGVVVADTIDEAIAAVEARLPEQPDGEHRIVVEECLQGEEASYICICDGTRALPFASSQDHKRLLDGDRGPNTGGMGAYSPAPVLSPAVDAQVMRDIVEPTLGGMRAEGHPYEGFLYVGLMISPTGEPKVIEFNCRFGDPEAQPIMARLQSDLPRLCLAALDGQLAEQRLTWDPRAALAVVLAAANYPQQPRTGDPIEGLGTIESDGEAAALVFHAGTRRESGQVLTSGGRVLSVVGLGATVADAQARAYERARRISWPGRQMRADIGYRALVGPD